MYTAVSSFHIMTCKVIRAMQLGIYLVWRSPDPILPFFMTSLLGDVSHSENGSGYVRLVYINVHGIKTIDDLIPD